MREHGCRLRRCGHLNEGSPSPYDSTRPNGSTCSTDPSGVRAHLAVECRSATSSESGKHRVLMVSTCTSTEAFPLNRWMSEGNGRSSMTLPHTHRLTSHPPAFFFVMRYSGRPTDRRRRSPDPPSQPFMPGSRQILNAIQNLASRPIDPTHDAACRCGAKGLRSRTTSDKSGAFLVYPSTPSVAIIGSTPRRRASSSLRASRSYPSSKSWRQVATTS